MAWSAQISLLQYVNIYFNKSKQMHFSAIFFRQITRELLDGRYFLVQMRFRTIRSEVWGCFIFLKKLFGRESWPPRLLPYNTKMVEQQVWDDTHVTAGRILTSESVSLAFERPLLSQKLTMNRLKDHKKAMESNFGSFELLSSAVGTKFLKKFQQQHQ